MVRQRQEKIIGINLNEIAGADVAEYNDEQVLHISFFRFFFKVFVLDN